MDPDVSAQFVAAASLTDVSEAGHGMEFTVYRATSREHGAVALRIAKCDIYKNTNDPFVEAHRLLEQEMHICRYLEGSDVPVPRHFGLLRSGGRVAALSEFVEDDDSATVSGAEMGRVLGLLHRLPPPSDLGSKLVAQEGLETTQVLPRRIVRRWAEVKKLVPALPDLVPEKRLVDVADGLSMHRKCLLHMDMRPANLRVRKGKIAAVTDWSNSLIGPAAVDLYRVLELVKPGQEFLEAYASVCPITNLTAAEEALLRLDAAIMLALVFLAEAPDPQKAPEWVQRVEDLNHLLKEPQQ